MDIINNISKEILQASYWEHFKVAKDLALYLEPNHPKRLALEKEINALLVKINDR